MSITAPKINDIDPLTALKSYLSRELEAVDKVIAQNLESPVFLIPTLGRHLIFAGGKRLRPLLTLACHRLFKETADTTTGLAAAVEFIHTATLLHDDVVDESKLRRTLPTANAVWGNQASVLVGDFLFAKSFQLMIETNNFDVLRILANASASISEGEVLQLSLCHNLEAPIEYLLRIIEAKTATLFAAACQVGTLMANQQTHAAPLGNYGQNLGMAFQIVDDILDYCADPAQLGKDVGDDFREGKITLPVLLAYPSCSAAEKEILKRNFIEMNQKPNDFSIVLEILQKHHSFTKAYKLAQSFGDKAYEALQPLPSHPLKDLLSDLIKHCLIRKF